MLSSIKTYLSLGAALMACAAQAPAQEPEVNVRELATDQTGTLEFVTSDAGDLINCRAGAAGSVKFRDFSATRSGNSMIVHIDIDLDSLSIGRNQRLVFAPMLVYREDSAILDRIVVNSRRQQIRYERGDKDGIKEGDKVMRRYNGTSQHIDYFASTPYKPWMENWRPAMMAEDCACGKRFDSDIVSVRRFEMDLQPMAMPYAIAYIVPPAQPKVYDIEKSSYIDFPVDQITLYPKYRRNPAELDSILRTINIVREDPDITIERINIHGWASPESPYEHNAYLAENRARTLKEYVASMIDLPASVFTTSFTPENWEGLRKYVEEGELPNRDKILAVIDGNRDPDTKEWIIKSQWPADYKVMYQDCYPGLRRSDYRITYTVPQYSLDRAKEVYRTKPQHLSLNELYLIANSYEPGSDEFNDVMETAVALHPNDEYANINAACVRIAEGDFKGARRYADKAGTSAEALNVRGLIAAHDDDISAARKFFTLAAQDGLAEAEINLAALGEAK